MASKRRRSEREVSIRFSFLLAATILVEVCYLLYEYGAFSPLK